MALKEVELVAGVSFEQQGELSVIAVKNSFATAKITPYGACVLSFIPKLPANTPDLLWVSPAAEFSGEKPVRGGIPICWPWFGKHPTDVTLPAHGFVRNLIWQLESTKFLESGATALVFSVESNKDTLKMWPHRFHLELEVVVSDTLSLCLTTTNVSDQEVVLTEAFHSYFNVSDARGLVVSGLEGSEQVNTLNRMERCLPVQKLFLSPPIDSIFLNHSGGVFIEDAGFSRQIEIQKQHSMSTIVWNPGPEIVKGFNDIPNGQWPEFLCVESGNVCHEFVTLNPRGKHQLKIRLQIA